MERVALDPTFRNVLTSTRELDASLRARSERLATGKRVNHIYDDPKAYFTAQRLADQASHLNGDIADNLAYGIRTIQTAIKGVEHIKSLVGTLEGIVQQASNSEHTKYAALQFDEVIAHINRMAEDSSYQSTNLLKKDGTPQNCKDRTHDLKLRVGNGANAFHNVKGQFSGNSYTFAFLYDPTIVWNVNEDGTALNRARLDQQFMNVNMGKYTPELDLGPLDNIQLRFRISNTPGDPLRQFHTNGDSNGNGVVESGEGFEVDFILDNSGGTEDANNISFSGAQIISAPAFNFTFNTSANLGNAPAGSTVVTDTAADLDANIPGAVPNGTEFTIQIDLTVNGVTYDNVEFGPLTVGAITSGQRLDPVEPDFSIDTPQSFTLMDVECYKVNDNTSPNFPDWAYSDRVKVHGADYEKDMYFLDFLDGQENSQTFFVGARRDGVGIFHSWMYEDLSTDEGRQGAKRHISEAQERLLHIEKRFQTDIKMMTERANFNENMALLYEQGGDDLVIANLNDEMAKFVSEKTRLMLAHKSLKDVALSYDEHLRMLYLNS